MKRAEIIKNLELFYPNGEYSEENYDSCYESDELDTHPVSIGNILKGALLDEMILEAQVNNRSEIFHCRLLGEGVQQTVEKSKSKKAQRLEEYSRADYIDTHEMLCITPLEPSIGNIVLFKSTEHRARVLLRIIEQNTAVELACYFTKRISVDNLPALQLTYPFIIRRVSSAREYRAKVPASMKFKVIVNRANKQFSTIPVNISHNGIAFVDPAQERSTLEVGEEILLEFQVPKVTNFLISASIAHITKLRSGVETQRIVGAKFTNSLRYKGEVEHLVAAVIEAHTQERENIASEYGIFFDDW